ncbi:MAG: GGDEF domain-containing protein [Patescibacteria group bacterium]|nr:GGDEF domain-containing protein [Patescibacteria group bacterium]
MDQENFHSLSPEDMGLLDNSKNSSERKPENEIEQDSVKDHIGKALLEKRMAIEKRMQEKIKEALAKLEPEEKRFLEPFIEYFDISTNTEIRYKIKSELNLSESKVTDLLPEDFLDKDEIQNIERGLEFSTLMDKIVKVNFFSPERKMESIKILALLSDQKNEILKLFKDKDPLTGLRNRQGCEEIMEREIEDAKRKNETFVITFIDSNDFGKVNNTYGHDFGDMVLTTQANLFIKNTRSSDTVIRYGGDEFLIIFHDMTIEDAKKRMEDLFADMEKTELTTPGDKTYQPTISCGLAEFHPTDTQETIIKRADQQMYEAKTIKNREVEQGIPHRNILYYDNNFVSDESKINTQAA